MAVNEQEPDGTQQNRGSWWTRWSSYLGARARSGLIRLRGALVPNTQNAFAATGSWLICRWLGDPNPIFAPIATFVCMGLSRNREPRKVIEMGFGASTGVLIGGLVSRYLGFGAWQLLILLLCTPLLGRLMDRSELVAFQVAVQSIVVAAMLGEPGGPSPVDRWLSALIGSAVALVATAILPVSVVTRPRRYLVFILEEVARTLRRLGKGLMDGDPQAIAHLRGRLLALRELLNDGGRALTSAQETAAISPAAYGSRPVLGELGRMLELCGRLHITLSMMQRQGRGMVEEVGALPEIAGPVWQAADLLERIAAGVREWQRPTGARDVTAELAAKLGPADVIVVDTDWRRATLMSLLRAIVVDMLQLTGLSLAQAHAVLVDTGEFDPDAGAGTTDEQPSAVWGTEEMPAVGVDGANDEAGEESAGHESMGVTIGPGKAGPAEPPEPPKPLASTAGAVSPEAVAPNEPAESAKPAPDAGDPIGPQTTDGQATS